MPYDCMNPGVFEREISRVACLLDELHGRKWKKDWWDGYHPRVYCRMLSNGEGSRMVSELHTALREVDVSKYSLQMQIWWKYHEKADMEDVKRGYVHVQAEKDRAVALAKLTQHERMLLGLE